MFRAFLCPSSRAYQLQQQPLVFRRNVVVAVLLALVGLVRINGNNRQCNNTMKAADRIRLNQEIKFLYIITVNFAKKNISYLSLTVNLQNSISYDNS